MTSFHIISHNNNCKGSFGVYWDQKSAFDYPEYTDIIKSQEEKKIDEDIAEKEKL